MRTLSAVILSAVSALSLLVAAAGHAAETPSSLIGEYRSTPKRVCMPGGNGHRAACSRLADSLKIEPTLFEGRRDVKVTAEFVLPDARICSFEGTGYWDERGRSVIAADASTGCELALSPGRGEVRGLVIRPQQCNSPCAGRGWLEGVVLRKK